MLDEEVHEDESSQHYRTLSERGQSYFEGEYTRRNRNVSKSYDELTILLEEIPWCSNIEDLKTLESSLNSSFIRHTELCEELIQYCERTKTIASIESAQSKRMTLQGSKLLVNSAMHQIKKKIEEMTFDKHSYISGGSRRSSHSSKRSNISSEIVRTKAKAEVAKTRLRYVKIAADMKKKQALLEATVTKEKADMSAELELLEAEQEVAAAEAEAEVLEAAEGSQLSSQDHLNTLEPGDSVKRTKDYVEEITFSKRENIESTDQNNNHDDSHTACNPNVNYLPNCVNDSSLNPRVEPFYPSQNVVSDFTRYLLKKDLLLTRLSRFDDRPESYLTWKVSFRTVMEELNVTALEELDLLVKYTGTESQKQVISIKSSNVSDPSKGLERVWKRLEERYGYPEMLEASLKNKVESFPKLTVKDSKKLYELYDVVSEIESNKRMEKMKPLLSHYDSSIGVTPLVNKLPHNLQEKWTNTAVKYMNDHDVAYPPFSIFVNFIRDQSRIKNNPSFQYEGSHVNKSTNFQKYSDKSGIHVRKTEATDHSTAVNQKCPLHLTDHQLNKCRVFKAKPIEERIKFLKEKKICFKCCESDSHMKRDCKKVVYCKDCNSKYHPTALHVNNSTVRSTVSQQHQPLALVNKSYSVKSPTVSSNYGGEEYRRIDNRCTRICGEFAGKSCAKIILANVYLQHKPETNIRLYVMLDDQSNRTLASSRMFDLLGINGQETEYILTSCSGKIRTAGRKVNNLIIESLDQTVQINLPTVIECNNLPENRNEIPTPEVGQNYLHLQDIAHLIPQIDNEAHIMMLIGRDVIKAHHVLDHRVGPENTPYGQKLPLGWTIIGESCLGSVHVPEELRVTKTNILLNGRSTLFEPCSNHIKVQESVGDKHSDDYPATGNKEWESFGHDIFIRTPGDDIPGLSVEDRSFLKIMNAHFHKDECGSWSCPLPFRDGRPELQNNYFQVLKRANILDRSLQKDEVKRKHFIDFMNSMLTSGHAEKAPPLKKGEEGWYLPIFGVYHHRKKDKVRVVFDSAAKYGGVSLNDVLLSGPDLTNSLLGIILRFRREQIAVIADIQQMFYCFKVNEEHRNYLRFFWHEDNDIDKPLIEYRMCVHIFGNTASPAIATYGLRLSASHSTLGSDVTDFVMNDFYVDDGLTSQPTVNAAVDLIEKTQKVLKTEGNIKLHKIASNHKEVMQAFPSEDLSNDLVNLELGNQSLPVQHSLGVRWSLESDAFLFNITSRDQPYSRRGVLSTINSIFDPLGFLAPVVIEGKLLLRKLTSSNNDWDQPLPPELFNNWNQWTTSLSNLQQFQIPRTYLSSSFAQSKDKSVHIFCDASENAIAAVAYIRARNNSGSMELGFILGKSKVAPVHGHTIPRLELCSAVLSTQIAETIAHHLQLPICEFKLYTDSKVILGYINNESRRFFNYVTNRVQKIRSCTHPHQWHYVHTDSNPADKGTRTLPASKISDSTWIKGPAFLLEGDRKQNTSFDLQDPEIDHEIRQEIQTYKTTVPNIESIAHRFSRFSRWRNLIEAIARLKHIAQTFTCKSECSGWHLCSHSKRVEAFKAAETQVLREVQNETYMDEILLMSNEKPLAKSSSVLKLSPYLDTDGLLRVGGRLQHSNIPEHEKHPILVPGRHHIAILLVRHYHDLTHHQGRHITEGAIRSAGFWITGGKSLISSVINKCVKCRKLRGSLACQKMANLPQDRLEPGPPFTNVGVDCFGPWEVLARRTRGGHANSKRWAVMFTCLTTRAIHIEVVEELSSSSFIMALKRLIAIRGPVSHFRSDRGTNFVGSIDDLGIKAINVEDCKVKEYLRSNNSTWQFNPPHASHMGGVWERLIGITRRILDSLLMDGIKNKLTHEMLVTFLAEASAIVNSRPLVPLTSDPDDPTPLTPSLLLTQKPQQVTGIPEILDSKNMYTKQWKRVQVLAQMFWKRWQSQYLQTLQSRQKWHKTERNISPGDVVLIRDKQTVRNSWPLGIIEKIHSGSDNCVRSCEVRITRNGERSVLYTRPVTELVLLIPDNC